MVPLHQVAASECQSIVIHQEKIVPGQWVGVAIAQSFNGCGDATNPSFVLVCVCVRALA